MQIKAEYVEIAVAGKQMRTLLTQPAAAGKYPGVVYFSDIFQLSGAMARACARLAGYGFVVAAHEFFHRLEPAGTVLNQDDEGRARGARNQLATPIAHFDEDCRAVIGYLQQHPNVLPGQLGAGGFCMGGHSAFRAALQPEIKATSCFYPTWLHNGKLGLGEQAGSLEQTAQIRGELLLVFGALDPLIPAAGRAVIETALTQAGVKYEARLFPADHGFMRDDRAAYDPECTDEAFAAAIALFRRVLK
ncbi:MAG: dienelactone hydrolase family protein [Acidobacteria bacterium]|nr:dienelactone hydrolase family protein [Acidobacteriota bacterium]MBI3428440.1 dienelactone hydrolase family protein [Acidobacteriota bacterium]